MKIGVITSAYPEYEDDPHGIFVHRLMREIVKEGHQVRVIAPFAGGKTRYNLEGVDVERFNYFYPKRFQNLAGRAGMIDNVGGEVAAFYDQDRELAEGIYCWQAPVCQSYTLELLSKSLNLPIFEEDVNESRGEALIVLGENYRQYFWKR